MNIPSALITLVKGAATLAAKTILRTKRFEKVIRISEKALNVFLELTSKRDSPLQKPHIVLHEGSFDLKFFLIQPDGKSVFCVLPLHISAFLISARRRSVTLERAGKISIVPESFWQIVFAKSYQAYLNSAFGEKTLLRKVAEGFEFVRYTPSHRVFGELTARSSLQVDLTKVLAQHKALSIAMQLEPEHLLKVTRLEEHEGELRLTVSLDFTEPVEAVRRLQLAAKASASSAPAHPNPSSST
ncbi:MAG: hypothetical protein IAF08_16735 [Rhizobacter sp.]|nr:hypothetical protein [Chlorobiales bacterium]